MSLRNTIEVITRLAERRVIGSYAIAGAVATLNYIEPMLTEDLDILISLEGFEKHASGLLLLSPIEKALADMGYVERTDVGSRIGDWPVQFLPVASLLDEEALKEAVEVNVSQPGEPPLHARVLTAEYIVATALKVERPKDVTRIHSFLDQNAVDLSRLKKVLERHNLTGAWRAFCLKAGVANPLAERP